MVSQTQTLFSEHQTLFRSVKTKHLQVDSSHYLQQLSSEHKGETVLDTQVEADGENGENEIVPSTSSSSN